jgi:hypothetical protein
MKPILLPELTPKREDLPKRIKTEAQKCELGTIDSEGFSKDEHCFPRLLEHLDRYGYSFRSFKTYYAPITYTWVKGSACEHTDPGFGKVAGWLIYDKRINYNPPELMTRHGSTPVRVGDIVIFNSDLPHAWLSNGVCILAMVQIKKKHKRSLSIHP